MDVGAEVPDSPAPVSKTPLSSLDFNSLTLPELGISTESFVPPSSGKSKSRLAQLKKRRSNVGARGSPETNSLIKYQAQQRMKTPPGTPGCSGLSPLLGRYPSAMKQKMASFQASFQTVMDEEEDEILNPVATQNIPIEPCVKTRDDLSDGRSQGCGKENSVPESCLLPEAPPTKRQCTGPSGECAEQIRQRNVPPLEHTPLKPFKPAAYRAPGWDPQPSPLTQWTPTNEQHAILVAMQRSSQAKQSRTPTRFLMPPPLVLNPTTEDLGTDDGNDDSGDATTKKPKRVRFGAALSPEIFDRFLPPSTPLCRGATPARSLASTGGSELKLRSLLKTPQRSEPLRADPSSPSLTGVSPFNMGPGSSSARGGRTGNGINTPGKIATLEDIDSSEVDNPDLVAEVRLDLNAAFEEDSISEALFDLASEIDVSDRASEMQSVLKPTSEMESQSVPEPASERESVPEPTPEIQSISDPACEMESVLEPAPETQSVPEPASERESVPEPTLEIQSVSDPASERESVPEPTLETQSVSDPAPEPKPRNLRKRKLPEQTPKERSTRSAASPSLSVSCAPSSSSASGRKLPAEEPVRRKSTRIAASPASGRKKAVAKRWSKKVDRSLYPAREYVSKQPGLSPVVGSSPDSTPSSAIPSPICGAPASPSPSSSPPASPSPSSSPPASRSPASEPRSTRRRTAKKETAPFPSVEGDVINDGPIIGGTMAPARRRRRSCPNDNPENTLGGADASACDGVDPSTGTTGSLRSGSGPRTPVGKRNNRKFSVPIDTWPSIEPEQTNNNKTTVPELPMSEKTDNNKTTTVPEVPISGLPEHTVDEKCTAAAVENPHTETPPDQDISRAAEGFRHVTSRRASRGQPRAAQGRSRFSMVTEERVEEDTTTEERVEEDTTQANALPPGENIASREQEDGLAPWQREDFNIDDLLRAPKSGRGSVRRSLRNRRSHKAGEEGLAWLPHTSPPPIKSVRRRSTCLPDQRTDLL